MFFFCSRYSFGTCSFSSHRHIPEHSKNNLVEHKIYLPLRNLIKVSNFWMSKHFMIVALSTACQRADTAQYIFYFRLDFSSVGNGKKKCGNFATRKDYFRENGWLVSDMHPPINECCDVYVEHFCAPTFLFKKWLRCNFMLRKIEMNWIHSNIRREFERKKMSSWSSFIIANDGVRCNVLWILIYGEKINGEKKL